MSDRQLPFSSIEAHGFLRVAIGIPRVTVADPLANAGRTLESCARAAERGAALLLFPELGLSAYSSEDLLHQGALLDQVERAAEKLISASRELRAVLVFGLPLRVDQRLFNCAAVVHAGRLLGLVPKRYLPNYREFYEKRQFTSARDAVSDTARLADQHAPFGSDLVFESESLPDFRLHVEICEDLWVPVPPSTWAALGGATVLANLSASNVTIAKADYRRALCASQSAKCLAAYLYVGAGRGESTTDLAWDGHAMVHENNRLLAESERFAREVPLVVADVDLDRLAQERMRTTSFNDCAGEHAERLRGLRRIRFAQALAPAHGLERRIERFPFVPSDPHRLEERCFEAYSIQVQGLEQRLAASGIERVVLGVSGGLDSTQALLVAVRTCDVLGLPRSHVLGYSMPGFATSQHTRTNAAKLMQALGVTAEEIDVRTACENMLRAIGHPYADGRPTYDVTFENVQAGERTSHLFRLANQHRALVLGTSDLSELALGFTTYGVGDHMSHYSVNASVPKTLIQHLIRWVVRTGELGAEASAVLTSILETKISPELVPGGADGSGPAQAAEDLIGPYELQDFNLYFVSRFGFRPSKIAFLAHHAWSDRARGSWPDGIAEEARRQYSLAEIKKWLEVFLRRFFAESQFKRSAVPNAPKVGSGGSLSPRADWRAPSDASAEPWLAELREHVPDVWS